MANPRTWTANDIRQGRLYLSPLDAENNLPVQRDYQFEDESGALMQEFGTQVLSALVPWANIPADIQDALQKINQWTYSQILAKEGME